VPRADTGLARFTSHSLASRKATSPVPFSLKSADLTNICPSGPTDFPLRVQREVLPSPLFYLLLWILYLPWRVRAALRLELVRRCTLRVDWNQMRSTLRMGGSRALFLHVLSCAPGFVFRVLVLGAQNLHPESEGSRISAGVSDFLLRVQTHVIQ